MVKDHHPGTATRRINLTLRRIQAPLQTTMQTDPAKVDNEATCGATKAGIRTATHHWFMGSLAIGSAPAPLAETIRAALTVPIVLAFSYHFFDPKIALFASLGALLVVLGERPGTTGQRLYKAGSGLLAGLLAMAAGPLTAGTGVTPILIVLAFAVISGILSAYGAALSFAGMQLLVQMAIAGGLKVDLPLEHKLIAYSLGGLIALAGAWLVSARQRTHRLYGAQLAEVLEALMLRERSLATHQPSEEDRLAQRNIDGNLASASSLVLTARAIGQRRKRFLQMLRSVRDGVSLATAKSFAFASPPDPDALQSAAQTLRSGNYAELPSWLTDHPGRLPEPIGKTVTRPWSSRHNRLFIVRLSLCMVAAEIIRQITPFGHGYWILLTVALILKPDITSVFSRSLQRGIGTAIGVVVASFVTLLAPGYAAILIVGLLCAGIPYSVCRNYAWFSVLITPVVLILLDLGGTVGLNVLVQRVIHTETACVLVLVLAYAFWPDTWRPSARPEIARLCDQLADLALSIPLDFDGDAAVALSDRRLAIAHGIAELRLRATTASSEPQGPRLRAKHWQEVAACLENALQAIVCSPSPPSIDGEVRALRSLSVALRDPDRLAVRGLRFDPDASVLGKCVDELIQVVAHLHVFGQPEEIRNS
ncbi:FUSC family protein [Paraburkholderia caffeinilytica]|uniref:FUSC family protein n=1 Tax=Paraburkholderia caffeinilytica TaxID=1761016 RepID=UPI0038B8FB07